MTDTPYCILADLLGPSGPLERHALLAHMDRVSRQDPEPWVAALRQLRAERPVAPAVVTYVLHLLTNDYAFEQALGDPQMVNLREDLRFVLVVDNPDAFDPYNEDDEPDISDAEFIDQILTKGWARQEDARTIRAEMAARRLYVEQAVLREIGEDEYAVALSDLGAVFAACRAGRSLLLGATWPLGFGDALRATGDLRTREPRRIVGYPFDVATAAPRDVLLTVIDRSSQVDRRRLFDEIPKLAEENPYPWLDALNALHKDGRVTADERYFMASEIATLHVFELEAADADERRMLHHARALERLYRMRGLHIQCCDDDELDDFPEELTVLRAHLWGRHHDYLRATLGALGEAEYATAYIEDDRDDHYACLGQIADGLFSNIIAPPFPWPPSENPE